MNPSRTNTLRLRPLLVLGLAATATLAAAAVAIAHPMGTDGGATAMAGPGAMGSGMMHGAGMMHGGGMMQGGAMGMRGMGMDAGGMRGPTMHGGMQQDATAPADMGWVHQLLASHESIRRTVTHLPDGIRTVTESDDPKVTQALQAHVASMGARLAQQREFNMFSSTVPVLFANADKIATQVENTAKGVIVTQTSADAKVAAALHGHADEVSELARDGMAAMHRSAMAAMGGGRHAGMMGH